MPRITRRRNSADRGASRGEHAYGNLMAAIHSGTLVPGQRVRETDVAAWLGISRTPVRDALKRLEMEGVLASVPRRGLVVSELDQEQVTELYAVRDVLEGLAGRLAAQHASPAEISAMRELLERQARARTDDLPAQSRLNRVFHDVIYRATRNRYLVGVLDSFESSLALLPGTTYVQTGRATSARKEHAALVDQIERRDPDAAERLARQHIAAAARIRLLMLSTDDDQILSPMDERQRARRTSVRPAKMAKRSANVRAKRRSD